MSEGLRLDAGGSAGKLRRRGRLVLDTPRASIPQIAAYPQKYPRRARGQRRTLAAPCADDGEIFVSC